MKKPADLAAQLLAKAANDLAAARIGLEHEAPLDTVCFHVQQAAEKAFQEVRRMQEALLPLLPLTR
jgi:HEPN domain-containing protein